MIDTAAFENAVEFVILKTDSKEWYESGLPSAPVFGKDNALAALYATQAEAQTDVNALLAHDAGLAVKAQAVLKGSIR